VKRIGITMGDPAGIGPEVLLKALHGEEAGRPLVFGDEALMGQVAARLRIRPAFDLRQTGRLDVSRLMPGSFSEEAAAASLACLRAGAEALEAGEIAALVTGPLHKRALRMAKAPGPGQTEWLSDRFGKLAVMLLHGPRLNVILATKHVPLRDVPAALTARGLIQTVEVAWADLEHYFYPGGPRIAVAALNPHGEEDGQTGREEREILLPAVGALREKGLDVQGPIPGDTVYALASQGRFDVVVAPYHDQGLAALKTLHFSDAVNVTLGLGVVRTSPDHGVAYDIAHKGVADASSMRAAIRLAAEMAHKGPGS
jgi:4-hydroxythreonine-4-phosphate dehydrogenase